MSGEKKIRPNESNAFGGRKAILNHASALVTVCPEYISTNIRGHEALHHHHHPGAGAWEHLGVRRVRLGAFRVTMKQRSVL